MNMDFLTNALIEEHLEECMEIVKEEMQDYYLDEDEYPILTREIMLTAQSAGGDFSEGNIRFYCDERPQSRYNCKTPTEVRTEALSSTTPATYPIAKNKRIEKYKSKWSA